MEEPRGRHSASHESVELEQFDLAAYQARNLDIESLPSSREQSPSRSMTNKPVYEPHSSSTTARTSLSSLHSTTQLQKARSMPDDFGLLATSFALIALVGTNDSATGSVLEAIAQHYGLSYERVSTVFLANVAGYLFSCLVTTKLTHSIGFRHTLILGAGILGASSLLISRTPPFYAVIIALVGFGLAGGLLDSALSTVIAHKQGSGNLMQYMYACFGIGACLAPIIVGGILDRKLNWSLYYYAPMAASIMLSIAIWFTFNGYVEPRDEGDSSLDGSGVAKRMLAACKSKVLLIGAIMMASSFGMTDSVSAWLVSWLTTERDVSAATSRYYLSAFWGGIALGRTLLSLIAAAVGLSAKWQAVSYLSICCALLGLVWLIHVIAVDAFAIVMLGIFMGPITPAVLAQISASSAPSLKGSVVSLSIAVGLAGSAIGPLAYGTLAESTSLATLPPFMIGICVFLGALWLVFPARSRRDD
ncbi:uncharacterized protein L969DRAFT_17190 [Mixia osmundae IAM 14324]|uniref:Major facilitator superfamily (MFS) profile domain-containing protein n=1 Tax=Mixia osmundae (strain CBS 9802 / IAM 14324 / JCM 22182 / KY 12970) TaxID=764103 RepID=G7DZS0_MIXOS|nr:uncharacterized protein L969DRAFT_17190 [Mixia osmundae IAM 14324]KEI39261.1 hypothetical protein L969DRAFT_17190 [Mixia osmundae IAM 14324]GAA96080.1 hypothetical protein E5Q_02741 [Mixia osmundae IAM 14324]